MLRVSTILQLQSVWDTIPTKSSLVSSSAILESSSSTHTQPAPLLSSAVSLVLESNNLSPSTSTSSLSSLQEVTSSSALPTPSASLPSSSIEANDCQSPTNDSSNSDALYHAFEQVHPLTPTAMSSQLHDTPSQKETTQNLNSSSVITGTTIMPPLAFPPPVPSKDASYHLPVITRKLSMKVNDIKAIDRSKSTTDKMKKKEKRSSKYGFFGSRSAATAATVPPPLPSSAPTSMITSPNPIPPSSNQLIDGANKTLRRETSKFNLRRKSLSKKVKRAISTIKLNGTTNDSSHAPPLPPTLSN